MKTKRSDIVQSFEGLTTNEIISQAYQLFGEDIAVASSFSIEDQVVTDLALKAQPNASIVTLDTGRVFDEVYQCLEESVAFWGNHFQIYAPAAEELEILIRKQGINGFYTSVDNRKACCGVRKIAPLARALAGKKAWIVGLRESQSVTREGVGPIVWDEQFGLYKIMPLYNWSEHRTWEYVEAKGLPYVSLQKKGYPSIGCRPCTRVVQEGQDVRAGRWWWENPETKECGLHT